ncbi:MAG: DoxX family protein [Bacteroidia bacterium]|nr:DoxX family protein [Bacteroidia bacterium]
MNTYQLIGIAFALLGLITGAGLTWESLRRKSLHLDYLPVSTILIWLTRISIGILFIYSGFVKANDYIGFAYKLEEYFTIFGQQWPWTKGFFDLFVPLAEPMAWFISVFEIALAIALILGWQMNLTAWLTMLMMVFFTILTGYSHYTGTVTDCGCFGDALKLAPWESFVKDIILTLMLIPVFLVRRSIHPVPNGRIAGWITALTFVVTGIFSWYCHEHLPMIDFRAYKIGTDLKICTTEPGPEGYPKCKDWEPYFPEEEIPLFEGNTLLVIMHNATHAPAAALAQSQALAQALTGTDIRMVGATATGPSVMAGIIQQQGLTYPFCYLDETVLKTIVRSNPGYTLLRNGIVVGHWHHNDTPDAAELQARLK